MLLSIDNLSKSFSEKPILRNISLSIEERKCYGLIGVNGAGKSTLLNIIIGELEHDSGELYKSSNLTIGYLKQNSGLDRTSTIIEEMRKVFSEVLTAENKLRELESRMSELYDHESIEYRQIAQEYTKKQAFFESRDGYQIDVKIVLK